MEIPVGSNIVSPAEGTVVYIKKINGDVAPISIKNKKEIRLDEIFKCKIPELSEWYLIGIFMHPTSVHVNRAPVPGIVQKIIYTKGNNLPMTFMWLRVLLRLRPYELYSKHILSNERNTILFKGIIPVFIVQIADIYVNKIECWIREGQDVAKGDRIGMIKMGSQVDILFPTSGISKIAVNVGDRVRAGESVLAHLN